MNIQEFFQQSAGKWSSQRTSHYLVQNQTESAKSDLMVEVLSPTDPAVVALCQQQQVAPAQVVCGVKINWSCIIDRKPKPQTGTSLLVIVADPDQPDQGKLIRQSGMPAQTIVGRYHLGEDEVLTLITDEPDLYAEERIWFANPTFRLRTSVVKQSGGFNLASFCSEIRIGIPPSAEKPATAEATS